MAKKNGRRWKKTVIGFVGNNTKGKQEKKFYSTWEGNRKWPRGKEERGIRQQPNKMRITKANSASVVALYIYCWARLFFLLFGERVAEN
jgi:hypothetical protein